MEFLQAVAPADRPGLEGSTFFSRLVLESVADLRDPAVVCIRRPLKDFFQTCPEEGLKTVWAALGQLKRTPEPLAPAQLGLDLMESCHSANQRCQVLELALAELESLPSPVVQSVLQGIRTRLEGPGERVAILREGLSTLLELRDDPHFKVGEPSVGQHRSAGSGPGAARRPDLPAQTQPVGLSQVTSSCRPRSARRPSPSSALRW